MENSPAIKPRLQLAMAIFVAFAADMAFDGWFVDDGYISFRFDYWFGAGEPFIWNIKDLPIVGFSNLLWTTAIKLFAHLPDHIETIVHWASFGLIASVGISLIVSGSRRRASTGPTPGLALFIRVLALPDFWRSAPNGIEPRSTYCFSEPRRSLCFGRLPKESDCWL